ncbi:MAG TPA: aminotransferase class V-fold PLP-dependent enzyme [Gemmatimonas aurantiaca]|uniref:Aminotransferase class V-fold PLP-dependent enzyme n=1 Tax=Gemmatimonas aurantiaca TaxID=173480 RepID=A0A3D4VAR4_9BACT|nr:aminotransferase class V-fold PLP-dependent enzyme [Gemmatimonas aurantiaca]HCT58215.1 aminotransferase class V-fold PLP-dependent enzyme [Gemmatimonas aurantiaca]
MDRRAFVAAMGGLPLMDDAVTHALTLVREENRRVEGYAPEVVADDEAYWMRVRQAYTIDANHVNLNSGSVSPAPRVVAEAMQRYWTLTNMSPSLYVDTLLYPEVEHVRRRLASVLQCDPETLALTRNTSESLQIAQMGLPLQRGDEIVSTTQDYPRMITAWRQRERRDGVVLKLVRYPVPPSGHDDLYERVMAAVTPRTKVIHICHITYTTGQIFPVRRICDEARRRGIFTIVDGGHSFAHFPFTIADLGCDVYGSSLHKWLCAPVGNGLLYVRKEVITRLWPLLAADPSQDGDIRKFESIGTYPISLRVAVSDAVTFHEEIGGERKAARLRYLRDRWMDGVAALPGVELLTPRDPAQSCAIGAMRLKSLGAQALTDQLQQRWGIHVRPRFVADEFECIRVTPNVFTALHEIDLFVEAIRALAKG